MSHVLQRMIGLDTPSTRDVVVQRDLRVPMRDGVHLVADLWSPRPAGQRLPTALVRTPYGRKGIPTGLMIRPLAERGYQVLVQSTRGTFGSGGEFDAMRQERADGTDTLDWVIKQPWFGGSLVLTGFSYLGYVQWAVADCLPDEVKAILPQVSESALTMEFLRPDGFSLETPFGWGALVAGQERPHAMVRQILGAKKLQRAMTTLPLEKADVAALGHPSEYIQDILRHDNTAERWSGFDHSARVTQVCVPVSSIAGWYDLFLPGQLRDFRALQDAGRPARLTVGPWIHTDVGLMRTSINETVEFGLALAGGQEPPARSAVRLYVMGEEAWQDFESWPPAGYSPQRFHLQPGGRLSTEIAPESEPERYRYDPADPTPSVGGARLSGQAGRVDNRKLEARADVLTFTTPVLDQDVEVVGEVSAQIWFRSSLAHADLFVRICDVDPRGRSTNVCDGLVSLTDADQLVERTVTLWSTAQRFKRGHRIRVQVSSGSFPRFGRNHGTGEPRATAVTLLAADQEVYHDQAHPSAVILPVRNVSPGRRG